MTAACQGACSLMRARPLGLLTGVSEVKLTPRPTRSVAAPTLLVTRITRQAPLLGQPAGGGDPGAAQDHKLEEMG